MATMETWAFHFSIVVFLWLIVSVHSSQAASGDPILVMNDIHLNLYYDPNAPRCLNYVSGGSNDEYSYGFYGCDPPEKLVRAVFTAMSTQAPSAPVLLPGDFGEHTVPQ